MASDGAGDEFITIVPVGESRPPARDPAFVTVLTVGAAAGAAEVVVCRPRGARLGLGLKFEGGSAAAEKVRRLLVQSCAEDSPAANARAPWGKLIPGDEILAIDGISVSDLTRIDCVRRLKDSDETLTLLVRHLNTDDKIEDKEKDVADSVAVKPSEITRPTTLPPPVPPRKLGKKNSFKDKPTLQTVGEQNAIVSADGHSILNGKENEVNNQHNGLSTITKLSRKSSFDSHLLRQNKEGIAYLKKGSPEEVRRLVRRLSDGKAMPPEAEVYIDLLSNEWERCLLLADAESDDTGSSISTVVDRLGSMASSVDNSIPSTPIMQPKTIDIQKVLNCIENIDSNILKDITSNKFMEKQVEGNIESKVEKSVNNGVTNHENFNPSENAPFVNKITQNDKNNNTVQNGITDCHKPSPNEKPEAQKEAVTEKPKPMPRSIKVERSLSERKPRQIPIPEMTPPLVPEPLLTPTKKNCIETWLQRSEAEMNSSNIEKLEEPTAPEALPRLIDFVPKPQFKEGAADSVPLVRPSAPPPPPPVETREDGSGASLDTIGELDESSDVTDSTKPVVIANKSANGKPYDASFWEDRTNKSDGEDKSLSNDETPLPTCPRQPPDGVETPSDAVEKILEPPARLPPRLPTGWPTTTTRPRYFYSRIQDARSEASVKDKIAMFSNDSSSTDHLDKCGTIPVKTSSYTRNSTTNYSNNYTEISTLDRRLTKSQDNLDEVPRSYKRHMDRPEALGSIENSTNISITAVKNERTLQDNKPLFYGSTTTLPSTVDVSFAQPVYHHTRSVSDDNSNKNVHKSNLEYLIEQRKKSMSKLRGLIIPEIQGPIPDLPEIKVQDNLTKTFLNNARHNNSKNIENKTNTPKSTILNDSKWKTNLLPNNLPKYSPAFKRKSLQVHTFSSLSKESTPERKFNEKIETISKMNNITNMKKPAIDLFDLKSGYDRTSTLPAKLSSSLSRNFGNKDHVNDYKNIEIKICTATEIVDSDNDSAMSSTQSSYRSSASSPMHTIDTIESDSSRMSPRISHYTSYSLVKAEVPMKSSITEKNCEEYVKRNVCRSVSSDTNVSLSSSAGSAATSGSQASCSSLESSVADSDKRKVSKSLNIDTINRRNILASAKCRSGRDEKLNSPLVETKFSHESYDRSPSPTHKASDRLSTLTTSVSAVTNKGDNRRRSKVIAETDSESDNEVNVRQRKTEFKNTRLKRNPSGAKNKQNEIILDLPKAEDAPNVISEKIIKEIKKAGLDNFSSVKLQQSDNKNFIEIKKFEPKVKEKKDLKTTKRETMTPIQKTIDSSIDNRKPKHASLFNNKNDTTDKTDSTAVKNARVPTHIIRLKRGSGAGVGLILAGGTDCEAKDVTVHRVLSDSVAAKAGLKRGAKVRSINGLTMAGLTHAQSVTILKEQRSEIVIEIEDETRENANGVRYGSENLESKARRGLPDSGTATGEDSSSGPVVTVVLEKAGGGAGLGFGLDGGRDSPQGDRPLTIKKLFAGGAAAQSGRVLVGAELLSAGGLSVEGFTRTQAWAALKALPAGPVTLVLRNPRVQPAS